MCHLLFSSVSDVSLFDHDQSEVAERVPRCNTRAHSSTDGTPYTNGIAYDPEL